MPIDFSILKTAPQQAGVVGQLPVVPNAAGAGAAGLMQGLQSGQEIAASRQTMQQNAITFQQQQQQYQIGLQHAKQIHDAAQTGDPNEITKVMMGYDPKTASEFASKIQDTKTAITQATLNMAKAGEAGANANAANAKAGMDTASGQKQQLENETEVSMRLAHLVATAQQAEQKQKGAGEAVYQQGLKSDTSGLMKAAGPQHYPTDPATQLAIASVGQTAQNDWIQKNGTPEQKAANRVSQLTSSLSLHPENEAAKTELNQLLQSKDTGTDLTRAQAAEQAGRDAYQTAVMQHGINSPEAQQAKVAADQAGRASQIQSGKEDATSTLMNAGGLGSAPTNQGNETGSSNGTAMTGGVTPDNLPSNPFR